MKKLIEALEKNNMEAHYFETSKQLCDFVSDMLPQNAKIASGGSKTLEESGVLNIIKSEKYNYVDRFAPKTPEEQKQMIADYFTADYFFCSANAVTENGELVNVDGQSNRVAAIMYGPDNVVVIIGKNKTVKNINEAFTRIKAVAAPKNTLRLNCNTFCKEKGYCVAIDNPEIATGCGSDSRICCNYTVTSHQRVKNRIKVLICNEVLGF